MFRVAEDGTLEFDIVGQAIQGVYAVAVDPGAAYEPIERLDHSTEIESGGVNERQVKRKEG